MSALQRVEVLVELAGEQWQGSSTARCRRAEHQGLQQQRKSPLVSLAWLLR